MRNGGDRHGDPTVDHVAGGGIEAVQGHHGWARSGLDRRSLRPSRTGARFPWCDAGGPRGAVTSRSGRRDPATSRARSGRLHRRWQRLTPRGRGASTSYSAGTTAGHIAARLDFGTSRSSPAGDVVRRGRRCLQCGSRQRHRGVLIAALRSSDRLRTLLATLAHGSHARNGGWRIPRPSNHSSSQTLRAGT